MNKDLLKFAFIISLLLTSCSTKENDILEEQLADNFQFNDNPGDLENFVRTGNAGVVGFTYVNPDTGNLITSTDATQVSNIAIEQIAVLAPPTINGKAMRASHIDIAGNYAYISYTKEGDEYLGGIDIIDISNQAAPILVSRLTTSTADINALFYLNNKIFFAAAVDVDLDSSFPLPARIGSISVDNGYFDSKVKLVPITGQVATDVVGYNNSIVGLGGGSEGSVALFNSADLTKKAERMLQDLRSAAYLNGKLAVLTGSNGVYLLDPNNLEIQKNIVTKKLTPESKRTIALYNNVVIVSEGASGAGIYDLNSGNLVNRIPVNSISQNNSQDEDRVTNAVSVENGIVFMANGSAGFGLAKLNSDNTISQEGIVEIDGSTNHVKAIGNLVLVASGSSGLRILRVNNTPLNTANCTNFSTYTGNPYLNINPNSTIGYKGVTTLQQLTISGNFSFCGTLNVQRNIVLNNQGVFNSNGALAVGAIGKNSSLIVNSNAVLRVDGDVTIYGNLILNNDAKIEFIGDNSSINVYGTVTKGSNVSITGNYTDIANKL